MPDHRRGLKLLLRAFGTMELFALGGLIMPRSWMGLTYEALDLGQIPSKPMFFFLARLTSFLFTVQGAILVFVSFDLMRYARLITLLAVLLLLQSVAVSTIVICEKLPLSWLGDSGAALTCGVLILALQFGSKREEWKEPRTK